MQLTSFCSNSVQLYYFQAKANLNFKVTSKFPSASGDKGSFTIPRKPHVLEEIPKINLDDCCI